MKKRYVLIIFCVLILLLSMSFVNAGFLDGIFDFWNEDSSETNSFTDMGISNNCSTDWLILPNVTKTVTNNGTIISTLEDSGVYANKPSTSISWEETFDWSSPFTVEFDILEWNGTPYVRIVDNDSDVSKSFEQLEITNGSHIKIVSENNTISYIIDNKPVATLNETITDGQIGFRLINSTITYKDFRIN